MLSDHSINMSVDIALHVFILFTFLSIFFFAYVSKLEKQNVNDTTNSVINEETNGFLNELDKWDKKLDIGINWKNVDKIAIDMQKDYNKNVSSIEDNNKKLLKTSIIIIVVIFILLIASIIFIKYYTTYDLKLKHIIITNIIIFSITGFIEYLFFTLVATKYVPFTPDFTAKTVLDRIKYNINN